MADSPTADFDRKITSVDGGSFAAGRFFGFQDLASLYRRRRRFLFGTIGGLVALCLAYCLIVPKQYDATSRVALRIQPVSALSLEGAEAIAPASILSTPLQLETLVNVFRSDRVEWSVIRELKLYQSSAFSGNFQGRFPGFNPDSPGAEAQGYLLERFSKKLRVRALPRTLLIEIRFRAKDPALAAKVVNALVKTFMREESQARRDATAQGSLWLKEQLKDLTARAESNERALADFERKNGLLSSTAISPTGEATETTSDPATLQVNEAARALVAASGERVLREALYQEAKQGDPEQVLAANPELQALMGPGGATVALQLRSRMSDEDVEMAQLKAEHGPNFPRMVELERARKDVEAQLKTEDANLVDAFRRSWQAAAERERLLQRELALQTAGGLKQNDANVQYTVLRAQANAARDLCTRVQTRIQEAELSAGVHASGITIIDPAREPFKAATPDLPLYLAITLVAGSWLAFAGALLLDAIQLPRAAVRVASLLLLLAAIAGRGGAQAPIPNTSGLPSGVVHPLKEDTPRNQPNPQDSPAIWNANAPQGASAPLEAGFRAPGASMALPIEAGDFLDVSEFHTPEFHSTVRVSPVGAVLLPLVGDVIVKGLSEQQAALAIEKSLLDGGMLLHPQVVVLVTAAIGQDVSVLGEVTRPGVYPYSAHHRLLDLISAASGLTPTAGRLVSIFHRDDPHTAHPIVLDPNGAGEAESQRAGDRAEHNPELDPGDTVLVSRAGLVYVIGDVVRPGGFAVDPVQGLTVVQALSLAWGATPNARESRAILIRDQPGGRTLTTLNLKRMIRGEDPDQPVRDKDILFVPDSVAKNMWNKTLESAIQSAVGVTIYAGLVYSQRF